jgi:hypothetical protein
LFLIHFLGNFGMENYIKQSIVQSKESNKLLVDRFITKISKFWEAWQSLPEPYSPEQYLSPKLQKFHTEAVTALFELQRLLLPNYINDPCKEFCRMRSVSPGIYKPVFKDLYEWAEKSAKWSKHNDSAF